VEQVVAALNDERLDLGLREAARIASLVATYCDRTEHNENISADVLRRAATRYRELAIYLAEGLATDLRQSYANRLAEIEARSPLERLLPHPADRVRAARTWRDLQLAQLSHDRHFHPDVFGASKRDQLIHTTLHLCKLTGALASLPDAQSGQWNDFTIRRLPDILLFGLKLATLAGETLDGELPRQLVQNPA
jgi:hypothetical protein